MIVFLHIPKTAGTSLSHLLSRKFKADRIVRIYSPADCARQLDEHAAKISEATDCVSGHIVYGLHTHLDRECKYFSMLRDPVSRVLSHYHFARTKDAETHPLGDVIEFAQHSTVMEYLQRFPGIAFEQIRALSGVDTLDRTALQLAKDNVTSNRIRVGLTEEFFQSTEILFQELGMGYPRFAWRRKNKGDKAAIVNGQTLSDKLTRAALEEYCALDIELYQHAQEHYAKRKRNFIHEHRTFAARARHLSFQAYSRIFT